MTPPRLGIGVIGAGRVGAVLGAALRAEGHALTGAYAVSDASRERAAELLPGVPLLDVPALVERSEMLLLAVPTTSSHRSPPGSRRRACHRAVSSSSTPPAATAPRCSPRSPAPAPRPSRSTRR